MMEPLADELKETIIREHPDGIWLVLTEENPPDIVTANDLLCGGHKAEVIPFQGHVQVTNEYQDARRRMVRAARRTQDRPSANAVLEVES
jgi:hypothetical protein